MPPACCGGTCSSTAWAESLRRSPASGRSTNCSCYQDSHRRTTMWEQILPGLRIKLFMTIVLGVLYPLVITGICQGVFPHRANGSLIVSGGTVIGSELIGQNFTKPEYFQPRPSNAGSDGYDAANSAGSNWGPTNKKLIDKVKASVDKFRKENPDFTG